MIRAVHWEMLIWNYPDGSGVVVLDIWGPALWIGRDLQYLYEHRI